MEVQRGEVVTICEVEREGGCPLAMVAGLPHCVDLRDGEVDGLPALQRREGLRGQGRGGKGKGGEEKDGDGEGGRGGEGRGGKGVKKERTHVPSYTGHACSDTTLTHHPPYLLPLHTHTSLPAHDTVAISERYSHSVSIHRVLSG